MSAERQQTQKRHAAAEARSWRALAGMAAPRPRGARLRVGSMLDITPPAPTSSTRSSSARTPRSSTATATARRTSRPSATAPRSAGPDPEHPPRRHRRDRGQAVLGSRGSTTAASSARRPERPGRRGHPGWQHDHDASGEEPLLRRQALTDRTFSRKIQEALIAKEIEQQEHQRGDPHQVPEQRLLRPERPRRRGRRPDLLQAPRLRAHPRPVGAAGRSAAGPLALRPVQEPGLDQARRNLVLDQMAEQEYITGETPSGQALRPRPQARELDPHEAQQGILLRVRPEQLRTQYGKRRAMPRAATASTPRSTRSTRPGPARRCRRTWPACARRPRGGDRPDRRQDRLHPGDAVQDAVQQHQPVQLRREWNGRRAGLDLQDLHARPRWSAGIDPDVTVYLASPGLRRRPLRHDRRRDLTRGRSCGDDVRRRRLLRPTTASTRR